MAQEEAVLNTVIPKLVLLRSRLNKNPRDLKAGLELAQLLRSVKDFQEAEQCLRHVLRVNPKYGPAVIESAELFREAGFPDAAIARYREALDLYKDDAKLAYQLGYYLHILKRPAEAEVAYEESLRRDPGLAAAHNNLAAICLARRDTYAAVAHYQQALKITPDYVEARFNLGQLARKLGDIALAEASFREVLEHQPTHFDANLELASLLVDSSGDMTLALICSERVVAADAESEQGNLLLGIANGRLGNAVASAQASARAFLLSDRKSRPAADNLVNALCTIPFTPGSVSVLADIVDAQPENGAALHTLCFAKLALCDWDGLPALLERVTAWAETASDDYVPPFQALYLPTLTARMHLDLGRRRAEYLLAANNQADIRREFLERLPAPPRRLNIGYFSSDFHEHPTSQLLIGVLEQHDPSRFHVHAFSFDKPNDSAIRQRIRDAVTDFHDLYGLTPAQRREIFVQADIDILIDIDGLTHGNRFKCDQLRPAPVIANWLACPASMGMPELADYIIGDPWVTPLEHADQFSETLALLPNSYQPNDDRRRCNPVATREAEGLPTDAFVFCSFNASVKFNPQIFDIWCRLLSAVPASVLWLLAPKHDAARTNLKHEMKSRGVEPERLIFGESIPIERHRARMPLADLALDTLPYNSHTTGSDALWAGVPMVTCTGETFASRVGASLLAAAGLENCIARNLDEYFELAHALACDPARLASLREHLVAQRERLPLFNTHLFTRNLERLFERMWLDHLAGKREPIVLETFQA